MVPWMRGIDRRWSVATEFCRRAGAILSALFWPGKKKKGRGPPLLGWRGERGEKSSSGGKRGDMESSGGGRNHRRRERQARRVQGKEKEEREMRG